MFYATMLSFPAKSFYPFWILEHPALNANLWVCVACFENKQANSVRRGKPTTSEVVDGWNVTMKKETPNEEEVMDGT